MGSWTPRTIIISSEIGMFVTCEGQRVIFFYGVCMGASYFGVSDMDMIP